MAFHCHFTLFPRAGGVGAVKSLVTFPRRKGISSVVAAVMMHNTLFTIAGQVGQELTGPAGESGHGLLSPHVVESTILCRECCSYQGVGGI